MTSPHNTRPTSICLAILLLVVSVTPRLTAQEAGSATDKAFNDARQLYDNGKTAEALAAFQAFEAQYGFSTAIPQAIYFQGWCWANLRQYQQAISTFARLIQGYPTAAVVPAAILKQAECYRELKNYAKAVEVYLQFETKYPKHAMLPQALLGEAWVLFKQNDLKNSQDILEKLRAQFGNDPASSLDVLFLLGQVLTAENNYDAARQIYRQIAAQRDNPRVSEAFYLAGEAMFDAKRYADAITYYRRVQSKSGLLERLREQINGLESQRATFLQSGALAIFGARLNDLRQLQTKFETGPDLRASALFRMANCYQLLGRPEEASVVYRELLHIYPADKLAEQAKFAIIQVLTERHDLDQADAESKEFQRKYPKSDFATDALFLQAETMFGSGQFQDALDRFKKFEATNRNPQFLETADFRIPACYYGLHDFNTARDGFLAFLQKHPDSKMLPEALFRLGRCYFEISRKATDSKDVQANLADAIQNFEQINAKFPTSELVPEVTFQLGYLFAYLAALDVDTTGALTTTANFEKAVASFQEFVKRWPDNRLVPEALYQIARNRFVEGKFDAAIDAYKQLMEKFPDSNLVPFGAYEIADCYARKKQPAEMMAALRDYAKRFPNHTHVGEALYTVALQLESENKPDEAITKYRNLIARTVAASPPTDDLRNAAIASELRIADILESRGDLDGAVMDCERFLGTFKEEPVAVRAMIAQIATSYRKAKDINAAYAAFDQLTKQYQQNASVRVATATSTIDLALGEGDNQRAYDVAQKLLADPEKDRLPPSSYVAVGNALLRRGQFVPARDAYQESLIVSSNDARVASLAQLGLGEAELGLNQLDAAEKSFTLLTDTNPPSSSRPAAALGLAKVYLARGDDRGPKDVNNMRAVDLLNSIMASDQGESSSEAAYLLGNYFFNFKDNEKDNKKTALVYYLRVALLTQGLHGEEAAFRSGQCHKALGNAEAARSAFQAYLRRFPSGQFAEDAKKELESLPPPPQS
jgi:outer membrane assembly lipoprotein YfiO